MNLLNVITIYFRHTSGTTNIAANSNNGNMGNRRVYTYLFIGVLALLGGCGFQNKDGIPEHDVLKTMEQFQRFSQKVWFAGEAENWDLAEFYAHELEELVDELATSDVTYEGYNLSDMSNKILAPSIATLENSIRNKEVLHFKDSYQSMLQSCNACHQATHHEFIKIIKPSLNVYNQKFKLD